MTVEELLLGAIEENPASASSYTLTTLTISEGETEASSLTSSQMPSQLLTATPSDLHKECQDEGEEEEEEEVDGGHPLSLDTVLNDSQDKGEEEKEETPARLHRKPTIQPRVSEHNPDIIHV